VVAENPHAAVEEVGVTAQVRRRERVPQAEDVRDAVVGAPDEPRDGGCERERDGAPERDQRPPCAPREHAQDREVEQELERALRLDLDRGGAEREHEQER